MPLDKVISETIKLSTGTNEFFWRTFGSILLFLTNETSTKGIWVSPTISPYTRLSEKTETLSGDFSQPVTLDNPYCMDEHQKEVIVSTLHVILPSLLSSFFVLLPSRLTSPDLVPPTSPTTPNENQTTNQVFSLRVDVT